MTSTYYPRLESARGIAALVVLVGHCVGATLLQSDPAATLLDQTSFPGVLGRLAVGLANGQGAVLFFFVLSGYVLSLSIGRNEDGASLARYVGFVVRRAFRLYPAHLVVLIAAILAALILRLTPDPLFADPALPAEYRLRYETLLQGQNVIDAANAAANAALLTWNINPVTWSLGAEVLASLLLPVFAGLTLGGGKQFAKLLGLGALLWLGFWGGPGNIFSFYLFAFYGGCLIQDFGPQVAKWASKKPTRVGVLILCFAVLVVPSAMFGRAPLVPIAEAAASWVLIALITVESDGAEKSFLDHRLARRIGELSYSIYLMHLVVLVCVVRLFHQVAGQVPALPLRITSVLLVTAGVACVTIMLSGLLFRFVEQPSIRIGRKLSIELTAWMERWPQRTFRSPDRHDKTAAAYVAVSYPSSVEVGLHAGSNSDRNGLKAQV